MKTHKVLHGFTKVPGFRWIGQGVLAFCIFGLLLLPFVHFHPENTHNHAGEVAVHHHNGHFHSQALEHLAHEVLAHPEDHDSDSPLHHDHSSQEHDSDQIEYTTLTLGSSIKNVSTDLVGWAPTLAVLTKNPSGIANHWQSYSLSPSPHLKSPFAIRAPPSV